jgi:hypothetical protein
MSRPTFLLFPLTRFLLSSTQGGFEMGKLKPFLMMLVVALGAIWLANNVSFIGGFVGPRVAK